MDQHRRQIENDVAVIKSNYATKADIGELRSEMHSLMRQNIMWSVGTIIASMGIGIGIVLAGLRLMLPAS